jgi:hypothetical protein
MSYFTHLTASEIVQAAVTQGINPNALLFADDGYLLPSDDWVFSTFAQAWEETKRVLGIAVYESDINDCDDYARMCAGYAQLLNNRTIKTSRTSGSLTMPSAALAFGEFWYASPQGPHAINAFLFRHVQGGPTLLGAIEPQTGARVLLTPKEVESCTLFRL